MRVVAEVEVEEYEGFQYVGHLIPSAGHFVESEGKLVPFVNKRESSSLEDNDRIFKTELVKEDMKKRAVYVKKPKYRRIEWKDILAFLDSRSPLLHNAEFFDCYGDAKPGIKSRLIGLSYGKGRELKYISEDGQMWDRCYVEHFD